MKTPDEVPGTSITYEEYGALHASAAAGTRAAPHDLTSLVRQTDFSDDAKWQVLQSALDSQSEYGDATDVSDPAYADVTVQSLVEADMAAAEDDQWKGGGGRDNG
ncbi:DUF6924 domain-containing protein [Streptomyces sp. NPDC058409]|uniref:DUF6924 domain-containing protein n=1 Tax=Streptomyces sp. NPDC058409 TaxID=3346484 RepID=UPI00364CC609